MVLIAKISTQAGNGQDIVGPSDTTLPSRWIQNFVCLQKKTEMKRLNLCGNKAEKAKCSPSDHQIKGNAHSGKQNPSEAPRKSLFGAVDWATKMLN